MHATACNPIVPQSASILNFLNNINNQGICLLKNMQMGCHFKPFEKMMLTIEVVIDPPDCYRFFRHFITYQTFWAKIFTRNYRKYSTKTKDFSIASHENFSREQYNCLVICNSRKFFTMFFGIWVLIGLYKENGSGAGT